MHQVLDDDRTVLCYKCMQGDGLTLTPEDRCSGMHYASQKAHAQYYPDCSESWHDMYDHIRCLADRDYVNLFVLAGLE
ncbi:hypothetical protein A5791_02355 [Mycobacterium sp. 852002-51163_SCH5372311]|nr:hypothetical protein A5791_02355 [Mycobacterium sp. 852002-51163_SCH5372311]